MRLREDKRNEKKKVSCIILIGVANKKKSFALPPLLQASFGILVELK